MTGFVVRAIGYLLLATFLAQRLYGWSLKQDKTGEVSLTQRQRNLGAGGLPFLSLAMTFAAFDWLMSLNPTWFSTRFRVYYFAGASWRRWRPGHRDRQGARRTCSPA